METINTSQQIIIPNKWDSKDLKSQELLENLNSVSDEEISAIWDEIDTNKIVIEELKKHVAIQEPQEMLWCEWKKVYIELPAVGDFKWFKFNYFRSKHAYSLNKFNDNNEYIENSFTINEMIEFFTALNDYLRNMWIKTSENIFSHEDENERKIHPKIEEYQKIITWYMYNSRLKDTKWSWDSIRRASFWSPIWFSSLFRSSDGSIDYGWLLFKI